MTQRAPRLFGSDSHYERWRWQIFAITWLAYFGFYLTRKSFSIVKSTLAKPEVLDLSNQQMGIIDGSNLAAYAIGMVICGVLGDRLGTRKVILFGMLGSVATAVAMGTSHGFRSLLVWFTLQGLFQSTGWAPLAKNVTAFFSREERGRIMGFWCTNYALGGFVANLFAGWAAVRFGWQAAFFFPAAALGLIWILFCLFQRNSPEEVGLPPIEVYHGAEPETAPAPSPTAGLVPQETANQTSWRVVLEVLANPVVLLLAAIYFCLKPTRYAILFWGPKYITERVGSNMAESGFISGMFELAGPASVIAGGWISDRVFGSRRMPVSVICLFLLGVLLLCLDRLPHTAWMLGSGLFLMGFLTYAPDSLVSGTAAVDFGTKRGASTASGLVNGAGSLGAIVGGTVPGFFREQWGWQGVFTLLAAAVFLAALMLAPKWNALPKPVGK